MNRVHRLLQALRPRLPSEGLSAERLLKQLDRDNRTLHELASTTEGDFIRLGEKLQDFYFRTRKLADLSRQIAVQLTGEAWLQWMAEIDTIFDRIRRQGAAGRQGTQRLESLIERFDAIRSRLASFDTIVRHLHVLCNYIKIESARLGDRDTGFYALGEDVRSLADSITGKAGTLADRCRQLMHSIGEGKSRITAIELQQAGQAQSILEQAHRNLSDMADHNRVSSQTLEEISSSWTRISHSIGEMVASMQFHDIVRQRIEHVREALVDVHKRFEPDKPLEDTTPGPRNPVDRMLRWIGLNGASTRAASPRPEVLQAACLVFDVQHHQLQDTRREIVGAVERIIEHLRQIADELSGMTQNTRAMTASGNEPSGSFLLALENHLANLAEAIAGYGDIQKQWMKSIDGITASVGEMSVFIHQIEAIGFQMKLIALNAAIHAAHIGQEGAALGVLADAIRQIADDTATHIETIAADLKALIEEASKFSGEQMTDAGKTTEARIDDLPSALHSMIESLKEMDETISALLMQIDRDGSSLMQDIETTVGGIDVHERMGQQLGQIAADLQTTVEDVRKTCPELGSIEGHPAEGAEDGTDRYTMEREREIHRSIAVAAATTLAGATAAASIEETGTDHPGAMRSNTSQQEAVAPLQTPDTDDIDLSDILFDMDGPEHDGSAEAIAAPDPSPIQQSEVEPGERPDRDPKLETVSGGDALTQAHPEEDLGDNVELF
ncbi:MAG: methyl-accepting chemotaxis protein [Thermodesulfobacteriota bacterium]